MTTHYLREDSADEDTVREDSAHTPDPGFVRNEKGHVTVVHHGAEQPAAPVPLVAPAAVPEPDRCDDTLRAPPQHYNLNESIGQFDPGSTSNRAVRGFGKWDQGSRPLPPPGQRAIRGRPHPLRQPVARRWPRLASQT